MKIGIIGTGRIGSNLARLFVKAGLEVILSWFCSPEKLHWLSVEQGHKKRGMLLYWKLEEVTKEPEK